MLNILAQAQATSDPSTRLSSWVEIGGFVVVIATILIAYGRSARKQDENTEKTEDNGAKTDAVLAKVTAMELNAAVKDERTHGRLTALEGFRDELKQDAKSRTGMFAAQSCPVCSPRRQPDPE